MGSANVNLPSGANDVALSLDEAIELMEKGKGGSGLAIDFGDGLTGEANDPKELDGLLQRARGLRLITLMAEHKPVDRPASMRSGKPALHPIVKEILDALKQSG